MEQKSFFEAILDKLTHPKPVIKKEALWTLSNIASDTPAQSRHLVNHPSLIDAIFNLHKEGQPDEVNLFFKVLP